MFPTVLLPQQTEVSGTRWQVAKVAVPSMMRLSSMEQERISPMQQLVVRMLLLEAIPVLPMSAKMVSLLANPLPTTVEMDTPEWQPILEPPRMVVYPVLLFLKELYLLVILLMDSPILFRSPEQMEVLSVAIKKVPFSQAMAWMHLEWLHSPAPQEVYLVLKELWTTQPLPEMAWICPLKHIERLLYSLTEDELYVIEATAEALKKARDIRQNTFGEGNERMNPT